MLFIYRFIINIIIFFLPIIVLIRIIKKKEDTKSFIQKIGFYSKLHEINNETEILLVDAYGENSKFFSLRGLMTSSEQEYIKIRLDKTKQLTAKGINPYPIWKTV